MSWGVALMWGTVIVTVVLGVLAAAYFYSKVSCSVEQASGNSRSRVTKMAPG